MHLVARIGCGFSRTSSQRLSTNPRLRAAAAWTVRAASNSSTDEFDDQSLSTREDSTLSEFQFRTTHLAPWLRRIRPNSTQRVKVAKQAVPSQDQTQNRKRSISQPPKTTKGDEAPISPPVRLALVRKVQEDHPLSPIPCRETSGAVEQEDSIEQEEGMIRKRFIIPEIYAPDNAVISPSASPPVSAVELKAPSPVRLRLALPRAPGTPETPYTVIGAKTKGSGTIRRALSADRLAYASGMGRRRSLAIRKPEDEKQASKLIRKHFEKGPEVDISPGDSEISIEIKRRAPRRKHFLRRPKVIKLSEAAELKRKRRALWRKRYVQRSKRGAVFRSTLKADPVRMVETGMPKPRSAVVFRHLPSGTTVKDVVSLILNAAAAGKMQWKTSQVAFARGSAEDKIWVEFYSSAGAVDTHNLARTGVLRLKPGELLDTTLRTTSQDRKRAARHGDSSGAANSPASSQAGHEDAEQARRSPSALAILKELEREADEF